jgi:hypothetical protein
MPPVIHRLATLSLTLVYAGQLSGCTEWSPRTQPVPDVIAKDGERPLRVTLQDGSTVSLSQVRLVADTLEGLSITGTDTVPTRIAEDQIAGLEVKQAAPAATFTLVLGTAAVVVGGAVLIVAQSMEGFWPGP